MPYDYIHGGVANVSATELLISIFDQLAAGFYDVLYPEILWRSIIAGESINFDINPGAQNFAYRSRDFSGMGAFILGNTKNIPRVGLKIGQNRIPILAAAVGANITNDEARTHQFGHQSALAQDYGEVMKKAADYHVERTIFFGSPQANFEAWLDYSTVQKIIAAATFALSTPNAIALAINSWLTTVWVNSKTVHMPDTVYLPPTQYSLLTQSFVINTGAGAAGVAMSVMDYIKKNNIYTSTTGKELNILPLRYLEGAGVAGVDRAVVMQNFPGNFVLPFSIPYQVAQPVPVPLGADIYAEYKFGSFHIKYPGCMAYVDGI